MILVKGSVVRVSFLLQGIMKSGPVTLTVTASASSATRRVGVRKTQEVAEDSLEQVSVSSSRGDHNNQTYFTYTRIKAPSRVPLF